MQLNIYKDYDTLSQNAAAEIIELVNFKPNAVLCLAAGDTPRLTYTLMAERAKHKKTDFTRCTFIGLDEWVGIAPGNEGSCHFFLQTNIFKPLDISPEQIHLFNALSEDLIQECEAMDKLIFEKGGIDLMLVGVGMNGHIGFNEPRVSIDNYSHVVNLDDVSQSVGQKYFKQATTLKKGITLGLKHLLEVRKVLLIANGFKKSEVIKKALEGEISEDMPASVVRMHEQGLVMLDEEAASLLEKK